MPKGFKELIVWNKSQELCLLVYKLSTDFPQSEKYALTSQIRRSSISIPANIAEGCARNSKKEFVQFLYISLGSLAETETFIDLAGKFGYLTKSEIEAFELQKGEIEKMLRSLIYKLSGPRT